jgi:hypothetical protein
LNFNLHFFIKIKMNTNGFVGAQFIAPDLVEEGRDESRPYDGEKAGFIL